jgi:carbonic anhydrase
LPAPIEQKNKVEDIVKENPGVPAAVTPETVNPVAAKKQSPVNIAARKDKQRPQQMLTSTKDPEKDISGRNIQLATNVTTKRAEIKMQKMEVQNSIAFEKKKDIIDEPVGPIEANEYIYTTSNDEIEILNTTVSKKNKLRGLFRKVSRVVEKTTNIDPGDVKGIRIASFEIELK